MKADLYEDKSFTKFRKTAVTENMDFTGVLGSVFPKDPSESKKQEPVRLTINIPNGKYNIEWIDTKSGSILQRSSFDHSGGEKILNAPEFDLDIALKILVTK